MGADDVGEVALAFLGEGDGGGVGATGHEEDAGDGLTAAGAVQLIGAHAGVVAGDGHEGDVGETRRADEVRVGEGVGGDAVAQTEQRQQRRADDVLGTREDGRVRHVGVDAQLGHPADARRALMQMARRLRIRVQLLQIALLQHLPRRLDDRTTYGVEAVHDAALQQRPALGDLRRPRSRRHERAAARHAVQQLPLAAQPVGAGHRREVDAEIVGKLTLRRQARSRRQAPRHDVALQLLRQRQVEGVRQAAPVGSPTDEFR